MTMIAIIGSKGYVGRAMNEFFSLRYTTWTIDKIDFSDDEIGHENYDNSCKSINRHCDVGVVCVPTPMKDDGSCDLSFVESVLEWLITPLIILKSTVPPGTTDALIAKTGKNIVFSPEFCGESTYNTSYAFDKSVVATPWFIFGGRKDLTTRAIDVYMKIAGPTKTYHQVDARVAEMTKYTENTFFATKVMFCNEIAEICRTIGIDYNAVRECFVSDPRVNKMHTAVFDKSDQEDQNAFGGKCFSKDLNALISFAKSNGYSAKLLEEVWSSNLRVGEMRKLRNKKS